MAPLMKLFHSPASPFVRKCPVAIGSLARKPRGEWRQASNPWHEPGIGNLVYNPPNIVHAMRSADQPLLAVWFLWTAQTNA